MYLQILVGEPCSISFPDAPSCRMKQNKNTDSGQRNQIPDKACYKRDHTQVVPQSSDLGVDNKNGECSKKLAKSGPDAGMPSWKPPLGSCHILRGNGNKKINSSTLINTESHMAEQLYQLILQELPQPTPASFHQTPQNPSPSSSTEEFYR